MGSVEDANERRVMKNDLMVAGWPDSSTYTQGLRYGDKISAVQVHEKFIETLVDLALTGYIDKKTLLLLGPCARTNLPRAMNLVGMVDSREGGEDTKVANFWQWPVLPAEPVRKDKKGEVLFA